ncbi:transmembrane protease serine 9-like [Anoplolepis gracilipes]|uniref:transmembrane protease serine 9-like n=1 Tax=Anoplolepis gracilipes TaxID=354296 RepID=UPI003B9FF116
MQYFILISLSCLIIIFKYANTLLWHKRMNRHTDTSYENFDYGCECGKKNIFLPSSRIIGGQEVFENEYPWMAGIISVNKSRVICGASIINDRYVITAAHCIVYGFNKDDLKVSVGAHDSCKWGAKSTIFSVENIFPHPNYDRQTNFADIMLVKLVMRITFNQFARPICLPKPGLDVVSQFGEKSVSALGWGFSETDTLFNKDCSLRIVDLTLFKQSECPTEISSLICAGYKASPRGTCGGDSGGPLQILNDNYKYILIGITSNGVLCANVNYPDYFTNVARMVPWILQTTKHDSKYCWMHFILHEYLFVRIYLPSDVPSFNKNNDLRIHAPCDMKFRQGDTLDDSSTPKLSRRFSADEMSQESRSMKSHLTLMAVIGVLLILDTARAWKHQLRLRVNPNCECGISGGISNRIVGGKISIPHRFPWVAAIFNRDNLHCGGTLINDRYVLTAGHCVKWVQPTDLSIGLGMHDIENSNEGNIIEVDKVILHEDFESDELHDTNDIALIRLEYPVEINDNVKPVCLPKRKDSDYTGHHVKVTGWGRVQKEGDTSKFLRQAILKVMSWAACKNTSFGEHVTESMLCAYSDNTDACQGDSGGPLLSERKDEKYEEIGIVSWGIGCADPGVPGVYVKITDYLNWIKYHSNDGIYCIDR